jgi:hypothetical protein
VRHHASGRLVGATRALLAVALGLTLSGCRLDLVVDIALDRDGGGDLTLVLRADDALQVRAQAAGVDPLADLAERVGELESGGWRVTEEDLGRGAEVRLSSGFGDAEEFNRLAADLTGALAAPEATLLEGLRLDLREDEIVLTGAAGLVPTDAVAELGLSPGEAVELASEEEAIGYEVRVTMPAAVTAATATRADGEALVWEIAPGERVDVRVAGERPAAPVWPLVFGAVLGLVAVAALLALRRRGG